MLKSKTVMTTWNTGNKQWHEEQGYIFTKFNSKFEVKVEDLKQTSRVEVECLCDYCLEEGIETILPKPYNKYIRDNVNHVIHKDSCKKHKTKKMQETSQILYGANNAMSNPDIAKKSKENNMKKHNGVFYNSTKECKDKIKNTCQEIYGSDSPLQNEKILDKIKNKNLKNLGVEYPFQSSLIQEKCIITLANNGLINSSKQQIYLHNLLGGKLNYPFSKLCLDIAYVNEKIYVEYDGGGHDLQVKFKTLTEEEFKMKEMRRGLFLHSKGWKLIKIISKYDYLPYDNVLIDMLKAAKEYLNSDHSWIIFDLDNQNIRTSQFINFFDYGDMRKIS